MGFGILLFIFGFFVFNYICDEYFIGFWVSVLGLFLILISLVAFFKAKEVKEFEQTDISGFSVYINGQQVDSENLDINKFNKVTYDYENEKILITID